MATGGMVATSQPLAAAAGAVILQQGGNAVDAAVATAASLTVVEPTSNGLGSDAFAMVWDGKKLHGLNSSGRSPAALSRDHLLELGHGKIPDEGWLPVTVPGAVAAWSALWRRFGRLSFRDVLAPAIAYARQGFPVSPVTAAAWQAAARRFGARTDFAGTFLPHGEAPETGAMFTAPDHAHTLTLIAESEGEEFYRGELSARIAEYARKSGGFLSEQDLAAHQPEWVTPLHIRYRGKDIWELPPNGQGIIALQALSILERFDLDGVAHLGPEYLHWVAEALKLAFADAGRYVCDPEWSHWPEGLLAGEHITTRTKLIGRSANLDPVAGLPEEGGTVYLCTADSEGRLVSYIQSNYMGFGSGVVVPGTGIALQNRGCGFTLEPGHPNEYAPCKRPFHTIIPAFLGENGYPFMPFGVMGGDMQPQGHVQVVTGMVDYGLNPQAVLDAPRLRVTGGARIAVEANMPPESVSALRERGHDVQVAGSRTGFGGGQIIYRHPQSGVLIGGSDPRKDGQVAVCGAPHIQDI